MFHKLVKSIFVRSVFFLTLAFGCGLILSTTLFIWLTLEIFETNIYMGKLFREQPWNLPSRVYARPFRLEIGETIPQQQLTQYLDTLQYRQVDTINGQGQYALSPPHIIVSPRGMMNRNSKTAVDTVRITWEGRTLASIQNRSTKEPLTLFDLEPLLLSTIYDERVEERIPVPLSQMPSHLVDCLLLSEDRSFYEHAGIDSWGILRAGIANLRDKRTAQGGSTITQQLLRSLVLTRRKTFARKFQEVLLAYQLEQTKPKEDILELYLNNCYLGQAGSINICGVNQGARFYFNSTLQDLSLAQSAMLVAILPGPNLYNPFKAPDRVKTKRDIILTAMLHEKKITQPQYDAALAEPLPTKPTSITNAYPKASHITRLFLAEDFQKNTLEANGLSILSTLDFQIQQLAETAVAESLQKLEHENPTLKQADNPLQAALVCLDAQTGSVLALVGGRDSKDDFNRAIQSKRPIGSIIKPFIYLYAFEQTKLGQAEWFPNSLIIDEPVTYVTIENEEWKPENYTKRFIGPVTLRCSLENSLNVPAIKLAHEINLDAFSIFLNKSLLVNSIPIHSLPLGTIEMSPLDVAGLYTTFTNAGILKKPHFIDSILDANFNKTWSASAQNKPYASSQSTFQVLSILQGVMERGTAKAAKTWGWKGIAAGKTGTTTSFFDSWFVGFTPEVITVVWLGFDKPVNTTLTGGKGALPVWVNFMNKLYPNGNNNDFQSPPGLLALHVDYETGKLLPSTDKNGIQEFFLEDKFDKDQIAKSFDAVIERFADKITEQEKAATPSGPISNITQTPPTPDQPAATTAQNPATPSQTNKPTGVSTTHIQPTTTATPNKPAPASIIHSPTKANTQNQKANQRVGNFLKNIFGDN
jgi:penicillin-binding protein 1B